MDATDWNRITELETENAVLRAQVAELEAEAQDLATELYYMLGDEGTS